MFKHYPSAHGRSTRSIRASGSLSITWRAPSTERLATSTRVADGVLNGTAKVASVQVKDENLAAHLQGPDFFDAQTHPELTFTSKTINRGGDRITIDGEITIKGHTETAQITGEISDPIADPYGGERFGLTLQTVVDRDTFGISWNNPLPSGEPALSNMVTITAELQLSKQA